MESVEKKINETHISVLRKIGEKIVKDSIELSFEFQNSFNVLHEIYLDSNKTIYDLETYIQNSPLKILTKRFDFCLDLKGTYQGMPEYKLFWSEEYSYQFNQVITELKLDKTIGEEDITKWINKRHEERKGIIIEEFEKRRIAYLLDVYYEKLNEDKEIYAYSHRKVGYTFPEFKLGLDFSVIFKTNFGYGSASYFFTHIKYKEIDVLPYSDWIRYRYARRHDIIRFTRRHQLKNSAWSETIKFVADLYNLSVSDPFKFVNVWIVNECEDMVNGLENLLNKNESFEIKHSYFHQDESVKIEGYDLIDFKGERISGALQFLTTIKKTILFTNRVDEFIERIKNCNLSIYPELKKYINELTININEIKIEITQITQVISAIRKTVKTYDLFIEKEIGKLNRKHKVLTYSIYDSEITEAFSKRYPENETVYNDLEVANQRFGNLEYSLYKTESLISKLEGYRKIIKEALNLND